MITKKETPSKRVIDLDGPEGNAFNLLGVAKSWGRQLDLNVTEILAEMTEGDYKNLVRVFDREFGSIVELQTNQEDLLEM